MENVAVLRTFCTKGRPAKTFSYVFPAKIYRIPLLKNVDRKFKIKEGYTFIKVKKDSSDLQLLLKMMLVQLQTLEETYGQFIKINQLMEV